MQSGTPPRFGPGRTEILRFLELFGVAGLAVAQPTFDLLTKNADLFTSRRIDAGQLVALVVALLLLPPLGLYVIEVVVGVLAPSARRAAHAVMVALPVGVFVEEAVKHGSSIGSPWLAIIGVTGGLVVGALRFRVPVVRVWLRFLSFAPVIFALLFLFSSSVTKVVIEHDTPQAKQVTVGSPHRVVWITLDEFPETSLLDGNGAVDAQLFPNFAELAASSNWYRNSTTIAPFTLAAVPGMLTSSYPHATNGVAAVAANYPNSLFTLLGGAYRVNATESFTVMCPAGICDDYRHVGKFHGGLRGFVTDTAKLWREFASPKKAVKQLDLTRGLLASDPYPMATAQRFVRSLAPDGVRPRLDFVHVLLPHWPWQYVHGVQNYLQGIQDTGVGRTVFGLSNNRWTTPWATRSAYERHLLQAQATDTFVGQVMNKLKAMGVWDESVVVVTADHGAAFIPGEPWRGLSDPNVAQVAWTPLFIKLPGQTKGLVDDRPARTVDILPTLADVLDVKIPWKAAGRSLLGTPRQDGKFKVIRWPLDGKIAHRGRFNIVDGPAGFAQVLRARAAPAEGDPSLRIYRTGAFGDLVGRSVDGIEADPTPSKLSITLAHPENYSAVQPDAVLAPWLAPGGLARPSQGGVPLAIAVNGVIGATTETVASSPAAATWWASLPPHLFHDGANDIRVYAITGTPNAPKLATVPGE